MGRKMKIAKFGRKYGFFLSDASNEEIVSISKELTDEMSAQSKSVGNSAIALLSVSTASVILSILLISNLETAISGDAKSFIFLLRMLAVAFFCLASLVYFFAFTSTMDASSVSTLLWRHVRETANDENAYEQMQAVRTISGLVTSAKNNLRTGTLILVLGGVLLGISYIYQMMIIAGYI